MPLKALLLIMLLVLYQDVLYGQNVPNDRFAVIEEKLKDLKRDIPGLDEKVDFAISGSSIQEFIRGLAESNNLNVSVDPALNFKVYNNFTNEKVSNIILFICREYDLDLRIVGTILSFSKYMPPQEVKKIIPAKEIVVKYNTYSQLLTLDLKNDTLDQVVKKITQATKKNVIFSSGLSNKLISVYIEDSPIDNALQKMAYANSLKVIKTDDDFFVIKSLEEGEDLFGVNKTKRRIPVSTGNSNSGNAYGNTTPSPGSTSGGPSSLYVEVKDSLGKKWISTEAINSTLMDVLKLVSLEAEENYFVCSDIKGNTTINVSHMLYEDFLTYLFQGTDFTHKKEEGIYLIGDRKLEGLRVNKVVQLQYRSIDKVMEVIPADIKKNVELKEFKELNSVILTGSLPQILEIQAFLKEIDRVVPVVMIEILLLDVRNTRTVTTGISAGLTDSTVKTTGTLLPGINMTLSSSTINNFLSFLGTNNAVNLGKVTPNFYMNLSALENNSNVEVRNMPKLSTLNGHDASLSIGSTRYYSVTTQNTLGSLTTNTIKTTQWNPVQANLEIIIKPIVSGDDQVTLEIDVNISDFLDQPNTNAPPPASNSKFKSIIRVKNEDMIALGGIEKYSKSRGGQGVPLLSRIPIIKWLFSSRTNTKAKTVSVVFIKPVIIY